MRNFKLQAYIPVLECHQGSSTSYPFSSSTRQFPNLPVIHLSLGPQLTRKSVHCCTLLRSLSVFNRYSRNQCLNIFSKVETQKTPTILWLLPPCRPLIHYPHPTFHSPQYQPHLSSATRVQKTNSRSQNRQAIVSFVVCICLLPAHLGVQLLHAQDPRMIVRHLLDAGNWTRIFR